MTELFTREFWLEAADRALKSFAQAILLAWGVGDQLFSIWVIDLRETLGFALGGAVLSLLTSIIASGFNRRRGGAGMLSIPGSTPPEGG